MKWALRVLTSAAILTWLALRLDWALLVRSVASLHVSLWLTAAALYVAVQALSSLRWQLVAEPLGFQQPLRRYLAFTFIAMFFGLFLPSVGGDVVRGFYLDGGRGRRGAALLSVLVDRAVGLGVLIAVAGVALLVIPQPLPAWVPLVVWSSLLGALAGVLALLIVSAWDLPWSAARKLRAACLPYRGHGGKVAGVVVLSLFIQAGHVAVVWLIGQALELPVPWAGYWLAVPVVSLVTLVPVSINGIGVREATMTVLLASWGVPEATTVLLVFLWFITFTLVGLGGAGFYLTGADVRPNLRLQDETSSTPCPNPTPAASRAAA